MGLRVATFLAVGLVLTTAACAGGGSPVATPSAPGSTTPASPTPGGSSPAPSSSPPSSSPPSSSGPAGDSALTVVVDDGAGGLTTWTLTCEPVGGDHPDAAGACVALDGHSNALNAVPKNRMCAQVYGGPERATITGTWRGEQVFAVLSRTDACETARWDALVPLVPSGGR